MRLQNLRKIDHINPFLAGFGIGVAASVLLAPAAGGKTRSRIQTIASEAGEVVKKRAENFCLAAGDAFGKGKQTCRDVQNERSQTMSDLKDKAKEKVDDGADAAKNATDKVVDKARQVAHSAGTRMEEGGNRLQDA